MVDAGAADLVLQVRRRAGGLRLTLRANSGEPLGTREVETAGLDCAQQAENLEFIASLMVDLRRDQLPSQSNPAPAASDTSEQTSPTARPTAAPPAAAEQPPTPPPLAPTPEWELGLGPQVSIGWMPEAAPAAWAVLGLSVPSVRWRFTIDAEVAAPTQAVSVAGGARFYGYALGARQCPFTSTADIAWTVCAAERLARVTADGFGFERDGSAARWMVSLGGAFGLRLRLAQHWSFTGSFAGLVALHRPTFVARDRGQTVVLHRPGPVIGVARAGLAYRF